MLKCKHRYLYTGVTTDVERRFREHRQGSAKFTRAHPPIRIVYQERFKNRSQAQRREAEIKSFPKRKKLILMNQWQKSGKLFAGKP